MSLLFQVISGLVHLGSGITCTATAALVKVGLKDSVHDQHHHQHDDLQGGVGTAAVAGDVSLACGVLLLLVGAGQLAGAGCGWVPRPSSFGEKATAAGVTVVMVMLEFGTSCSLVYMAGGMGMMQSQLSSLEDQMRVLAPLVSFLLLVATTFQVGWIVFAIYSNPSQDDCGSSINDDDRSVSSRPSLVCDRRRANGNYCNNLQVITKLDDLGKHDGERLQVMMQSGKKRARLLSSFINTNDQGLSKDGNNVKPKKKIKAKLPLTEQLAVSVDRLRKKSTCSYRDSPEISTYRDIPEIRIEKPPTEFDDGFSHCISNADEDVIDDPGLVFVSTDSRIRKERKIW